MISVSVLSEYKTQIIVSTTPTGVPWSLTGSWQDFTWTVPGGEGVGDGGQLHLTDVLAPTNVPVVYTFRAGATVDVSAPVVIIGPRFLLQRLDGSAIVEAKFMLGSIGLELDVHQELFFIPNRSRPAIRYGTTGDGGGMFRIRVDRTRRAQFDEVMKTGGPIVYRTTPPLEDLAPVETILVGRLTSEGLASGPERDWSFTYVFADYPTLEKRLGGFPWDDFDAALAGQTWNQFDTRFAGTAWDQFDLTDWLAH
ncbi:MULTISPECIES: hypothetical protein [unclassified Microbacterium]|uniref:hypothetical protein n=1 Tax=unclassified Microbacterium TaxID=2609290 RepID=UPI003019D6DE